jgi:NhaP-type Na+/H+ or K+/H+ antiporter
VISLLPGITFSHHATNFIKPLDYTDSQANLDAVTLYFTRLVLGVQFVLAGVQLPSRYLQREWKPLAFLLGPVMTAMWLTSSLLVWGMVPHLSFLHALAIGACVPPIDPVLSNSIVKGKFADKNIPKGLQRIIIAESGANDGLGYPFVFLALYLIKYTGEGGLGLGGGARAAMGLWFGETLGYTVLLSVIYGATVGWIAKELLHWAEEKKFVDRKRFLVFAIALALFILGTCGMIGSDDVLACFIAGNTRRFFAAYHRYATQPIRLHMVRCGLPLGELRAQFRDSNLPSYLSRHLHSSSKVCKSKSNPSFRSTF